MVDEQRANQLTYLLHVIEITIYYILALLLAATALAAIAISAHMLLGGMVHRTIGDEILPELDELLVVLMIIEIFHTVRIAIRSHILLAAEPFLIVGVIASIRRVLVISLETSTLAKEVRWTAEGAGIFRASMIELGLLIVLVLVLVVCIVLLRRYAPASQDLEETAA